MLMMIMKVLIVLHEGYEIKYNSFFHSIVNKTFTA